MPQHCTCRIIHRWDDTRQLSATESHVLNVQRQTVTGTIQERAGKVLESLAPIGGAKRGADEVTGQISTLRATPRRFDQQHVAVIAVLCCLAAAITWWSLSGAGETTVLEHTPTPVQTTDQTRASPTPKQGLMVHVLGAVRSPGVIELPAGARVQAAIQAAGGLRDDADPGQLNLAAQVSDGMQILIGTRGAPNGEIKSPSGVKDGSGKSEGSPSGKVNLNTASEAELQTLPGVGPATAKAILTWRSQHGRFTRVEELQEVDGIGPKTLAKLVGLVQV